MRHCELRTNQTGEHWRVKIANELLKLVFAWHEFIQSAGEDILISVSLDAKWQYFSLLLYRHSPRYIRLPWLQKGTFVLFFDEGETSKLCVYFWPIIWNNWPHAEVLCWKLLCRSYCRFNCTRVSEKGAWAIEETVQLHNAVYGVDFQPPGGGVEPPLTSPSSSGRSRWKSEDPPPNVKLYPVPQTAVVTRSEADCCMYICWEKKEWMTDISWTNDGTAWAELNTLT